MIDSYEPLGVTVPLMNMLLGEVVFGGLGTGLQSMLMLTLVGVLLGGLMVGRTPEYLGQSDHPFGSETAGVVRAINPFRSFSSLQLGDQHRHGPGRARHQYGAACFDGSGVRLRLQYGEQRDDHGRLECQQRLLQYDHGLGDVGPLWLGRSWL